MAKLKLRGKDLRAIGYPEGPVISIAMNVMEKSYKHYTIDKALAILKAVLDSPADYKTDEELGLIAHKLLPDTPPPEGLGEVISLNNSGINFNVFGSEFIEPGAMNQMYQAALYGDRKSVV